MYVVGEFIFFTSLLARVELLTTSLNNLLYTNLKLSVCFVFYFPPFWSNTVDVGSIIYSWKAFRDKLHEVKKNKNGEGRSIF